MTPEELYQRAAPWQMDEWEAVSRIWPWGFDIENFRSAIIAQTMANIHRSEKQEPFKVTDFMVKTEPDKLPEPESPETLFQKFAAMFRGK